MTLKEKIKTLSNVSGVSGDEYKVAEVAAQMLKPYMKTVEIDKFGNVIGYKPCGKADAPSLLLDAHIDQVGFMVNDITADGFLRFIAMGVDPRTMQGSKVKVLTKCGEIPGTICATPLHQQKDDEKTKVMRVEDLVVDIGVTGQTAVDMVSIGDYMVFAEDTTEMFGNILCGKALDDRACFCCILHALDLLEGKILPCNLIISATTKEEQGGQGAMTCAYHAHPNLAIAVDVCHARTADSLPTDDVHDFGGGAVVGIGSNSRPRLARRVLAIARAEKIPYQCSEIAAGSGTNAWGIQLVNTGIATMVVSLPLKYMHTSVEMLSMSDVENTGRLLAEICLRYDGTL